MTVEQIMELVDEYGKCQKDFGAVESTFGMLRRHYIDVAESYDELRAAIEELHRDAERYRDVRRGQKWSVIDGIGDTLRADDLDAAIDAAMQEST